MRMIDSEVTKLLGKRAVATDCFEWRPGMLILKENLEDAYRFVDFSSESCVELGQLVTSYVGGSSGFKTISSGDFYSDAVPDCSDPATIGCLVYLVRDLYKMPTIWTVERDGIWYTCWSGATHGGDFGSGVSEAEALVSALEHYDNVEEYRKL